MVVWTRADEQYLLYLMERVPAFGIFRRVSHIMATFNRSASASRTFLALVNKYRRLQVQAAPQIQHVRQDRNALQQERVSDFQSEDSPAPQPPALEPIQPPHKVRLIIKLQLPSDVVNFENELTSVHVTVKINV